jgi:hypothetical protein
MIATILLGACVMVAMMVLIAFSCATFSRMKDDIIVSENLSKAFVVRYGEISRGLRYLDLSDSDRTKIETNLDELAKAYARDMSRRN